MNSTRNLLDASLTADLNDAIRRVTGSVQRIEQITEVGGGSISRTFELQTSDERWFLKLNNTHRHDLFEAEADGLNALGKCPEIRVPAVIAHGVSGQHAYLLLEYLELFPLKNGRSGQNAGHALDEQHRIVGQRFGWHQANFIGSTPQENNEDDSWPRFFAQQRLRPQLELAKHRGFSGRFIADGERLADGLSEFFAGYAPCPSLLHGDLWHGNAAQDESGKLTLFDPAVYFGDRETDLAMMELFGGFPQVMFAAYRESWPLADGYSQRKTLYQLYHILNHLNLFGTSYQPQAERMIGALLAEMG